MTLFQERGEISHALKAGQNERVALAGADRKSAGTPVAGTIPAVKMAGNLGKVTISPDRAAAGFQPGGVVRLWIAN